MIKITRHSNSNLSLRSVARIVGLSTNASLFDKGDVINQKLRYQLKEAGFDTTTFNQGVPVRAVSTIVEFYAPKRKQAKAVFNNIKVAQQVLPVIPVHSVSQIGSLLEILNPNNVISLEDFGMEDEGFVHD